MPQLSWSRLLVHTFGTKMSRLGAVFSFKMLFSCFWIHLTKFKISQFVTGYFNQLVNVLKLKQMISSNNIKTQLTVFCCCVKGLWNDHRISELRVGSNKLLLVTSRNLVFVLTKFSLMSKFWKQTLQSEEGGCNVLLYWAEISSEKNDAKLNKKKTSPKTQRRLLPWEKISTR